MQGTFGKFDMTPPLEVEGSYRLSPSGRASGVHDPLFARWMILSNGEARWCLVVLDLVGVLTEQADRWRKVIAEACGIPGHEVSLTTTHTHNGPDLLNEWGAYDHAWEDQLLEQLAAAIAKDNAALRTVHCGWVETRYDGAINRHQHQKGMPAGTGPTDPTLSILTVDTEDGTHLGHVMHYSAHPTTAMGVGGLLSADYPGVLVGKTEQALGGTGIFLQGAAGNINLEIGKRDYPHTERHGTAMAELVVDAVRSGDRLDGNGVLMTEETMFAARLRRDYPGAETFEAKLEELDAKRVEYEREHPSTPLPMSIWNSMRVARLGIHAKERFQEDATSISFPIQHVHLVGRRLLVVPGEWFVEFALALKKDHPGTLWSGYGNGTIGYVPIADAWNECYMERCAFIFNVLDRGEGERLYGAFSAWLKTREQDSEDHNS